jgi:Bacterial regulatory helix-turn-helix protein, lysR family
MMAPLYDVFVATVLEGRSQRAAAKSCDCSPALLSKRVGELEKEFGLPLKQLQNYAQPLLEMETSVKGHRHARKKRGAPPDEAGQYDEEDGQAANEDDNGYQPEERQDDS